jgi:CelD/BcsL family acetyltransferase involved in cellulose biosynthesis
MATAAEQVASARPRATPSLIASDDAGVAGDSAARATHDSAARATHDSANRATNDSAAGATNDSAARIASDRVAGVATATLAIGIEELRDRGALAALRPSLDRLAAAMAAAGHTKGPFLSADWATLTAAALTDPRDPERLGDFRLLVAHQGGTLVAALPLIAERRRLAGAPARLLRSLSDDHSQRFDLWLDPGPAGAAAVRALVAHLAQRRDWDALELQSIPAGGSAAARLVAAARHAGLPVGAWTSMTSPYLSLPATTAELDRQLGSKFRGNLRRRARKLETEVGPLTLEHLDGSAHQGAALDAALDEGFALEAAGWKGELGTAIACDPRLRSRYRALAHAFATRGRLACYFLKAGSRRVAFHFALVDGDTYYLFKPGFDPALASYGLGHLLVDLVARDLVTRGIRELDFLGDDMPWKREWTDRTRAHRFDYVFAPSLRGRILAAWKLRLVPRAKRLWPQVRALCSRLSPSGR